MIKFINVSKVYQRNIVALKNISLTISDKEFVSIVGPSGAGKSTIVRLLIREEFPSKGRILIDNQDITALKSSQLPLLRKRIGIVFQDFKLLPNRTAYENIAFAMEVSGFPLRRIREDVPRILRIVGLSDKADAFPTELSGGEKQRVATARALIHRPDILVADEPTGNLDPINTWEIIKLLTKINELGTTVILATHDKEIINALKKRVISLKDGQVIRDEERGGFVL